MNCGGKTMSQITREQIQHVANLARLNLSPEEEQLFIENLNEVFAFMDKLNELDTAHVPPTSHVLGITNVMRADERRESLSREEALKNAPEHEDGQFKVPAVMGE